jgi:hypothetical protein
MDPLVLVPLVVHDVHELRSQDVDRWISRGVVGIETDLYLAPRRNATAAWARVVADHQDCVDLHQVASRITRCLARLNEVYVDVKCPVGQERDGTDAVHALATLLGDSQRLRYISRNHDLVATLSRAHLAGPIVSERLCHIRRYLDELGASLFVSPSIFLDAELTSALATDGVVVVTFPALSPMGIEEAHTVAPNRIMVEAALLEGPT